MFESKRKIRRERDEFMLQNNAFKNKIKELEMQIPTNEKFKKTELCKFCSHCRGYHGYWICELEKQPCKNFD